MAQNRPNKPSVTLPDNFGGVKNEFSSTRISTGYESSTPEIVEGGNLNYMLDGLFRNTKYMRTVLDYVRDTPVGKMFWVNQNGQMDYIQPAIIATNVEFNTGTATDKTPNVKQVVDKLATKANNNAVVHLTGNETISGEKTFTGSLLFTSSNLIAKQDNGIEGGQINFEKPTNSSLTGNVNIDIYGNQMRFIGVNSSQNHTVPLRLDLETNIACATASDAVNSVVTTTGISKSGNGFVKLGNGIIIQWGYSTVDGSQVTLPTPFTSTNYRICATYMRASGSAGSGVGHVVTYPTNSTSFYANTEGGEYQWIAIGY